MRIFVVLALAFPLAGCNVAAFVQNTADVIQEIREKTAEVRAGVKVAASVLDGYIVRLCSRVPEIDNAARQVRAAFPTPGPKTAQALADAEDALSRTGAACAAYTGNGSVNVYLRLAAAFEAGRAGVMKADAAGGT